MTINPKRPATFTRDWLDTQAAQAAMLPTLAPVEDSSTRALDDSIRAAQLDSMKNQRILRMVEVTLTHTILFLGISGLILIWARHHGL